MEYFEKLEQNPYADLKWNIPEQKMGVVNIVGGNAQNFRTSIKVAEFLERNFPIEKTNTVLPDALRTRLPPLENFRFLSSTESGSFSSQEELLETLNSADYNILIGDFSKNMTTGRAVASASGIAATPLLITRDAVDLITENDAEKTLLNEKASFFLSMMQLQKLTRAIYYPKMVLLSQSLVQIAETLHKFTLSYPATIITLHNGQILVAKNGEVRAVALERTEQTPISIWNGEMAAKVATLNLFNPGNFLGATICAFFA